MQPYLSAHNSAIQSNPQTVTAMEALQQTKANAEYVVKRIHELSDRLGVILKQSQATCGSASTEAKPDRSALREAVLEINEQINFMQNALGDIFNRLDI